MNEDLWLGNRDSNPNKQSQSLSCYRYTIPQNREQDLLYHRFSKSQALICFFQNFFVLLPVGGLV